ncbi:MAG TPA: hypothetical protein VFR02_03680, partial [bacterium]|nr:hypothetical protein [bacterium]
MAGRLALFAGAFLFLAALGLFLASHLKGDRVWRGRCFDLPEKGGILDEVDSDHFDGYDRLYYGIGPAVENARRADILLLGNSRVLFAFRAPAVRAFEQKSGLKVFNFCFPANDGLVMAWEAIQRNDLRPSLVVVNENQFFDLGRSPYGTGTVEEGRWGAWTRVWEDGMSWDARCWLHRFFPRFGFGDLYPAQPTVTVQSSRDGCLLYEDFSRGRSVYPLHGTGAWDH